MSDEECELWKELVCRMAGKGLDQFAFETMPAGAVTIQNMGSPKVKLRLKDPTEEIEFICDYADKLTEQYRKRKAAMPTDPTSD